MRFIKNTKAVALSLLILLNITALAQRSDGFFRNYDENYENRSAVNIWAATNGIQNDDFGAPVGSGLLILTAAGAGYMIARRRRYFHKSTTLLIAGLMLVGMTHCKKNIVEPVTPAGDNQVAITLNVDGGAKAEVDPPHVSFENEDQIVVISDGHYVGTLTHNGTNFSGSITDPVVGKPLYFYFLGNNAILGDPNGDGDITNCTVNISDQTNYPHLPVISMGVSINRLTGETVSYETGTTSYEAQLHNKCSLMKLNVTSTSTKPICITGMNNKVTVDFTSPNEGFSYSVDETDGGLIKMMGSDDSERWIIVLPQAALATGGDGTAFTNEENQRYKGSRPAIGAISSNQYLNSGIDLNVNTADNSITVDLSKLVYNYKAKNGETLTGTLTGNHKISIANGATMTLNGAIIDGIDDEDSRWAGITCEGNATIILKDGSINDVNGFYEEYPGIYVPSGKTLTIKGETVGTGKLYASNNGYGAGIGGVYSNDCGNIEIQGGTIVAIGGIYCAGIGSGYRHSCGNITISGGTVTAIGGKDSAGIGSALGKSSCGDITISGGTVMAFGGEGNYAGAGIGCSGHSDSSCGDITIIGGTVTATCGTGVAAVIGRGENGSCGNITFGGAPTTPTITLNNPTNDGLYSVSARTFMNPGNPNEDPMNWEENKHVYFPAFEGFENYLYESFDGFTLINPSEGYKCGCFSETEFRYEYYEESYK